MWTSLGVIGSVGVVNAVRYVFVDLPKKVGLQVALPATAPSTITPEATCRHLVVVVLLKDKEALNKGGENVIRAGDLEKGGEIVNRGGVFELGGRKVIRGGENVIRDSDLEQDGKKCYRR
ncbi:hypothetical protein Tco_1035301 [Tanacetum coccineum]